MSLALNLQLLHHQCRALLVFPLLLMALPTGAASLFNQKGCVLVATPARTDWVIDIMKKMCHVLSPIAMFGCCSTTSRIVHTPNNSTECSINSSLTCKNSCHSNPSSVPTWSRLSTCTQARRGAIQCVSVLTALELHSSSIGTGQQTRWPVPSWKVGAVFGFHTGGRQCAKSPLE